jgi:glycosyltransferase involved in cell wall biosynthesis
MPIAKDELSKNAMGGTELMKNKLASIIDPSLLDKFQIFLSRVQEPLSQDHVRVLWFQDLAGDPASEHLANNGWEKFHKFVFASNWQMRGYIERYNIPWSKCVVLLNAMEPIDFTMEDKKRDVIRLTYISTPHRGLQILVPVFKKLRETFGDKIELDVYSSFKIYGWGERDEVFNELFEECKNTPGINYHGSVPNAEIREALKKSHILAYPNIWQETSCISLMESMSAGLICVHPNYGALPETAANWTHMYQWHEDLVAHANIFYTMMVNVINDIINMPEEDYEKKILIQKSYADVFYSWKNRKIQWEALLNSLKDMPTEIPQQKFIYRTS